eukprot:TRINITY_DN12018_c0_g1_i5.p3 TRINITY_DN12018_c0_g1~~TRINITY_DN12018_c0_g1_i5.p3  ORF type:complete len:242 (+),score=7.71 TRINITY_DN12018_c0_g1_i5:296-1021(+)
MVRQEVVITAFLLLCVVKGKRNPLYNIEDEYTDQVSHTVSVGDEVYIDANVVAQLIITNTSDTSDIARGIAEVMILGDESAANRIANALVLADNLGEAQSLGNTFYKILIQEEGGSSSQQYAESMAFVINQAISNNGCNAISEALVQMYVLALEFTQTHTIQNVLYTYSCTKECIEQTISPLAITVFTFEEKCTKDNGVYCHTSEMSRRFLYDLTTGQCYEAYECKFQGYETWRECNNQCV